MAMSLFNSYDGSSTVGFVIGGLRLVCLNGMRVFERIYRWASRHVVTDSELQNTILINLDTAIEVFSNKLVPAWKQLTEQKFEQAVAQNLMQSLELSKLYQQKFDDLIKQREQLNKLQTLWDLYNVVTFFTTHWVENRNRMEARRIMDRTNQVLNIGKGL